MKSDNMDTGKKKLKFLQANTNPNLTRIWFESEGKTEPIEIKGKKWLEGKVVELISAACEDTELTCVANIRKAVRELKPKPMMLPNTRVFVPCNGQRRVLFRGPYEIQDTNESTPFRVLFPRDLPMMTSETLKFIDSRLKPKYGIRNLKKVKLGKKTTVELDDGRKGVATLNPVDVPDPYVAFALAYTKSQFENSTAFYNFVDKIAKKNKRYGVYLKGVKLKAKKEEDK